MGGSESKRARVVGKQRERKSTSRAERGHWHSQCREVVWGGGGYSMFQHPSECQRDRNRAWAAGNGLLAS